MNLLNAIYKSLDNIMEMGITPNVQGQYSSWNPPQMQHPGLAQPQPNAVIQPPVMSFGQAYAQPMMQPAAQIGMMQQPQAQPKQPKEEKESSGLDTSDILKYLLGLGAVAGGGYGIYKMNQPSFAERAIENGLNFARDTAPINKTWILPWVKEKWGQNAAANVSGLIDAFAGIHPDDARANQEEIMRGQMPTVDHEAKYGRQLKSFEDSTGRTITPYLHKGTQYNLTREDMSMKLREIAAERQAQHAILGNANSTDDEKKAAKQRVSVLDILEKRRYGNMARNPEFKNANHARRITQSAASRSAAHAANVRAQNANKQQNQSQNQNP